MMINTGNRVTKHGVLSCKYSSIEHEEFQNCTFKYSPQARFFECAFYDCIFKDTVLENSHFKNCRFTDCNFVAAHMEHIQIKTCEFIRCNFYNADLVFSEISKDNRIEDCYYLGNECPTEGEFIAYKKVFCECGYNIYSNKGAIVTLKIPADAKRLSTTTKECRCSKAEIIAIEPLDKSLEADECIFCSYHDASFEYKVGEIVEPRKEFCDVEWLSCASGIHFFMNKEDAINY